MAVERIAPPAQQGVRVSADPRKIRQRAMEAPDDHVEPSQTNIDRRDEVLAIARFDGQEPEVLVAEIGNLWRRAQEEFLAIGRCLINARELIDAKVRRDRAVLAMTPQERRTFVDGEWAKFVARLPFGQGIASQLERVSRALDSGRLARDELPSSYSVAYQLTTLTDAELEAARRQEGVVGPSATRSRIVDFKRRLREARMERRKLVEQRREKILANIERLREELEQIDRELAPEGIDSERSPSAPIISEEEL